MDREICLFEHFLPDHLTILHTRTPAELAAGFEVLRVRLGIASDGRTLRSH